MDHEFSARVDGDVRATLIQPPQHDNSIYSPRKTSKDSSNLLLQVYVGIQTDSVPLLGLIFFLEIALVENVRRVLVPESPFILLPSGPLTTSGGWEEPRRRRREAVSTTENT